MDTTPGDGAIVKDFDVETALRQIEIEVNNPVQNVRVSVEKYEDVPESVTVSKSGRVYRYLKLELENIGDNLERAGVMFQVEKDWIAEKEDVALFKFDPEYEVWNELETVFVEPFDDEFYYYEVELDSFSYFAIGERVVEEVEVEGDVYYWVGRVGVVLVGVLVLFVLVLVGWWFGWGRRGEEKKK